MGQKDKKMVPRQQVLDYISSSLRSGYDLPSIRSRLLSSGYDPSEVNAAIDLIKSGKTVSAPSHAGTYTLLALAMIGFILVAGVATVFFKQSSTPVIPTPDTTFTKPTPAPSGSGNTQSSDTRSQSSGSGNPVTSGSTALSGTTGNPAPETSDRSIPPIDYSAPSQDTQLTTRLAIENKVYQLAPTQPDQAAQLCNQINTVAGQQSCLNTIAQASGQSRFCAQLADTDAADICLTNLALQHAEDVNLCKQIKSDIRFRQCVVLYDSQSQVDTLQKAAADVAAQPLSVPAQPSEQQIVDGYTTNFDDVVNTTVVTNATIDANVTDQIPAPVDTIDNTTTDPNASLDGSVDSNQQTI